jgi:hypothetical protein
VFEQARIVDPCLLDTALDRHRLDLELAAVILPLGLDTLGVCLALGLGGLPVRNRLRVALLAERLSA